MITNLADHNDEWCGVHEVEEGLLLASRQA
jgi:hypothetical protein